MWVQNLYREDLFFADKAMRGWSTTRKEGFELFSEKFIRTFPGYHLDKDMRIRPNEGTRTINLEQLKTMLAS